MGVVDPGRNAVHFEGGGRGQHHDVWPFPTWFKRLPAVSFDKDPVSRPVLVGRRDRASLVDGL